MIVGWGFAARKRRENLGKKEGKVLFYGVFFADILEIGGRK